MKRGFPFFVFRRCALELVIIFSKRGSALSLPFRILLYDVFAHVAVGFQFGFSFLCFVAALLSWLSSFRAGSSLLLPVRILL